MGIFDRNKKKQIENYVKKAHFFSFYTWAVELFKQFYSEHENVKNWISHLNNKTERIEKMHNDHKKSVKRNIKEIQEWIYNAFEQNKNTKKDLQKTQEIITELYKQHKETILIINGLKQESKRLKNVMTQYASQSDTKSVTECDTVTNDDSSSRRKVNKQPTIKQTISDTGVSQNVTHMTDRMSQDVPQTKKNKVVNSKINEKEKIIDESRIIAKLRDLNMSEKRVIYLLIHNNKELNYQNIAEKLDMNYSTIKNIIYRLRKRNIPIKDTINRRGEKEFYVPENIRIALKTRK